MRQRAMSIQYAFNENFNLPSAFLLSSQTGLDDTGIVEYQQVARIDKARQVAKLMVSDQAAFSVEMQHSARRSLIRRVLCDQFRREEIIEVACSHDSAEGGFAREFTR